MNSETIALAAVAVAVIGELMLLFGSAGTAVGVVLAVAAGSAYFALVRFPVEHDAALALSIPLAIIALSTLSYGIGFLIGLKAALFTSLGLLLLCSYGLSFLKTGKQKT